MYKFVNVINKYSYTLYWQIPPLKVYSIMYIYKTIINFEES